MSSRLLSFLITTLILVTGAAAQQACSTVEVPVGVISAGGETFRGLAADSFVVPKGAVIKSLTFDDGPRRILVVVDTAGKLSSNVHKAAAEALNSLVAATRPEDSLALITARGPGGSVKFGEDRAGMARALSPQAGPNRKEGVLDAVMDGLEWFNGSRPGDAVVVIANDLDGNHKTNVKAIAKMLAARHIRLFGLALGPVQARSTVAGGSMTSTTSQGLAWTTPATGSLITNSSGDEHLLPLTSNSGGLLIGIINEESDTPHNMNDAKVQQQVRYKAQQLYKVVSVFYRMQIESPQLSHQQGWTVDVNESIRKSQPAMWVLYPHELGPC